MSKALRKSIFVKVCGLMSKEQIDMAVKHKYSAIGVVTHPNSPRYCNTSKAIDLAEYAKGKIKSFVVGIKYSDVKEVKDYFDIVQTYEYVELCNLAFASKNKPDSSIKCKYFLYDASVGKGIYSPLPDWLKNVDTRVVIAGGLNKNNVAQVIKDFSPYGIDVSSGVEIDGIKNCDLMEQFIKVVKVNSNL